MELGGGAVLNEVASYKGNISHLSKGWLAKEKALWSLWERYGKLRR